MIAVSVENTVTKEGSLSESEESSKISVEEMVFDSLQELADIIAKYEEDTEPARKCDEESLIDQDSEADKLAESVSRSLNDKITGFTKFDAVSSCRSIHCECTDLPYWGNCAEKRGQQNLPFCCGPSRLKKVLEPHIIVIEERIIRRCSQIKEINILLKHRCRSKATLLCQVNTLHNILLRTCLKVQQLENKHQKIKMAICCPKVPPTCHCPVDCYEEIANMRRLEQKIETLYNYRSHKDALHRVAETTVLFLKKCGDDWRRIIGEVRKIGADYQEVLNKMIEQVCRKQSKGAYGQARSPLMQQMKNSEATKISRMSILTPRNPPSEGIQSRSQLNQSILVSKVISQPLTPLKPKNDFDVASENPGTQRSLLSSKPESAEHPPSAKVQSYHQSGKSYDSSQLSNKKNGGESAAQQEAKKVLSYSYREEFGKPTSVGQYHSRSSRQRSSSRQYSNCTGKCKKCGHRK